MGGIHHGAKKRVDVRQCDLNRFQHVDTLRSALVPSARATFQNNLASFMTILLATPRVTRGFFAQDQVEVMSWPANSPEMYPIEHVWHQMGMYIREMANPPSNLIELRRALRQGWDSVTLENIQHLVDGMRRRVTALSTAHGGHTQL